MNSEDCLKYSTALKEAMRDGMFVDAISECLLEEVTAEINPPYASMNNDMNK